MKQNRLMLAALAALAIGGLVATTAVCAQTDGMERRDDRGGTREEARDEKAACKAGDEATRSECRQDKRDTKQDARGSDGGEAEAPAAAQ